MTTDTLYNLAIDSIQPGRYQPRKTFDPVALDELAQTLMSQGILQPLTVRPVEDQYFEIIAGERRWRAAQIAGLSHVPCILKEIDDKETALIALVENIKRQSLTPLEEAEYLAEKLVGKALNKAEVARAIGKTRGWVSNSLRLNEAPEQIKQLVRDKKIRSTHARALLTLPLEKQIEVSNVIISRGLSVQQTEKAVKDLSNGKPLPPPLKDINITHLECVLSEKMKAPVTINMRGKSSGSLTIEYYSKDELERIEKTLINRL